MEAKWYRVEVLVDWHLFEMDCAMCSEGAGVHVEYLELLAACCRASVVRDKYTAGLMPCSPSRMIG